MKDLLIGLGISLGGVSIGLLSLLIIVSFVNWKIFPFWEHLDWKDVRIMILFCLIIGICTAIEKT